MPEANYGFQPTPEMEPFGVRIAHIARMNFESCGWLVGKPTPQKDVDLGKTADERTGKKVTIFAASADVEPYQRIFTAGSRLKVSPVTLPDASRTKAIRSAESLQK